jgi:hypothetical protein
MNPYSAGLFLFVCSLPAAIPNELNFEVLLLLVAAIKLQINFLGLVGSGLMESKAYSAFKLILALVEIGNIWRTQDTHYSKRKQSAPEHKIYTA